MCGFSLVASQGVWNENEDLVDQLRRRGPHSCTKVHHSVSQYDQGKQDVQLSFTSTVLSLRGESVVQQPLVDDKTGSLFCWNGEAWKLGSEVVSGNDARLIFCELLNCTRNLVGSWLERRAQSLRTIMGVLGTISGPFSFLFYDTTYARVYYGRDVLGRRSLLIQQAHTQIFMLASVSNGSSSGPWKELEADGVYYLDLPSATSDANASEQMLERLNLENPESCWYRLGFCPWAAIRPVFPSINRSISPQTPTLSALSRPIMELQEHLINSLLLRVTEIPFSRMGSKEDVRIAIMFSGGLDCTILARLCHDILPTGEVIDLLNVAFENPRIVSAAKCNQTNGNASISSPYDMCPDRITGLSSYAELSRICIGRQWNFVTIDIPYQETLVHRKRVISLMYPHDTEMDLSISLALYFAARGCGTLLGMPESQKYVSSALVLLSGLGADELFGGYGRHAVAFKHRGQEGLIDELDLDFQRIGQRNLGRDDRVISHWGKEVRYPYLDEDFVSWVLRWPVWEKCDFRRMGKLQDDNEAVISSDESTLAPEKSSLRLLAWRLGMQVTAREKKRAIQFGARTAKMVTGRVKGTQIIAS